MQLSLHKILSTVRLNRNSNTVVVNSADYSAVKIANMEQSLNKEIDLNGASQRMIHQGYLLVNKKSQHN